MSQPTSDRPLISISEGQLDEFFSVDEEGRSLTLRQYILRHSRERGLEECAFEEIGAAQATAHNPDSTNFGRADVERLVDQYLDSMPEDEVLEIVGQGPFTAEQLREEVRNHTAVGEQIIGMVLADHAFVEDAIKKGHFRVIS